MSTQSRLWRAITITALLVLTLVPLSITSAAEEEEAGNNLSVPVMWADGSRLTLPTDGYEGTLPFFDPTTAVLADDGVTTVYPQKSTSKWVADNLDATATIPVTLVDWGDNLEARAWRTNSAVRVETSLKYSNPGMTGYAMRHISGQGPDEMWGATGSTYTIPDVAEYEYAHVYTNLADLMIQFIDPEVEYTWTSAGWVDPSGTLAPVTIPRHDATAELNISGKVVYGYNWRSASTAGTYRISFILPADSEASLATAAIEIADEETLLALAGPGGGGGGGDLGGGVAAIDPANNLTYIDANLTSGGGGGGGGRRDVQVVSVNAPTEVDEGAATQIVADIKNNGEETESVTVSLTEQPGGHTDSKVVDIAAGATVSVTFDWTATTPGNHDFTISASITGDEEDVSNNTGNGQVRVRQAGVHDVEVMSMTAPASVTQGTPAQVIATVRNNGTGEETFDVTLGETPGGFQSSKSVTLQSGATTDVTFDWPTSGATTLGNHDFTATAILATDGVAGNNSKLIAVAVTAPPTVDMWIGGMKVTVGPGPRLTQRTLTTTIAVVSTNGPVSGATVTAEVWTMFGQRSTGSGVTAANGTATITFTVPRNVLYRITVIDADKDGYDYAAERNRVTRIYGIAWLR